MEHKPCEHCDLERSDKAVKVLEDVRVDGVAIGGGISGRVNKSRLEFETKVTVSRRDMKLFALSINGVEITSFAHGSEVEERVTKAIGRAVGDIQ